MILKKKNGPRGSSAFKMLSEEGKSAGNWQMDRILIFLKKENGPREKHKIMVKRFLTSSIYTEKQKSCTILFLLFFYEQVELFLFLTLFLVNSNIKTLTLQQLQ